MKIINFFYIKLNLKKKKIKKNKNKNEEVANDEAGY
jgi:hypothetical protein